MTGTVLPGDGAVLGIDVGYSTVKRSSAVCRLHWTEHGMDWTIERFRKLEPERADTIVRVAGTGRLLAAAFDGPMAPGLGPIVHYRAAERMLTRRLARCIGKPGQSSAPVGRRLNKATNECARIVLDGCNLGRGSHTPAIDGQAVAEAFPSTFMGVMLAEPQTIRAERGNRSDLFFEHLAACETFADLLGTLLPGRVAAQAMETVRNHDDRAALVCAFTALCVAAYRFTAVGNRDGWIILPPRAFIQPWAWDKLTANAAEEQPGCLVG